MSGADKQTSDGDGAHLERRTRGADMTTTEKSPPPSPKPGPANGPAATGYEGTVGLEDAPHEGAPPVPASSKKVKDGVRGLAHSSAER